MYKSSVKADWCICINNNKHFSELFYTHVQYYDNLLQIPQPKNEKHNLLTNLDLWTKDKDFRYTETKNLSPYAMFGDNSMVLRTKQEREGKHSLEIVNRDVYSHFFYLELNYKTGVVKLLDKQGNILGKVRLKSKDLARFLSPDPLTHKQSHESPYVYVGNDPANYIDPDGRIRVKPYTDTQLNKMGLTREDYNNFVTIVHNAYNVLVKNNDRALEAIMKSTGLSRERIINDLSNPNAGPLISIDSYISTKAINSKSINFQANTIKSLSEITEALSNGNVESRNPTLKEQATQVLGLGITVIHEYIHTGDLITNGKVTGQPPTGEFEDGKQIWSQSLTGHRGTDFAFHAYRMEESTDVFGKMVLNVVNRSNLSSETTQNMNDYGVELLKFTPLDFNPNLPANRLPQGVRSQSQYHKNIINKFGVKKITNASERNK